MLLKTRFTPLAAALLPLCLALPLQAETRQLDPLVITANRLSQPLSQTLAGTTLITRTDIERLQPSSLADLLQTQAGVEIGRNGGSLAQTSVFMRGANSNHTLILINGQKINDPTAGSASLQFIALNQIERIEIVRGPQSSAWGADALGGVINIITHGNGAEGFSGQLSQHYGSDQTWQTDLSLGGSNGRSGFNAGLSLIRSDGFNAQTADTSGEKDAYEHYAFSGSLFHQLNAQHRLQLDLNHSQGENDYDNCQDASWISSNACRQDFNLTTAQLGWQVQLSNTWQMQLHLQTALEQREDFREGQPNGETETRRDTLRLDHHLTGESYTASVGADLNQEKLLEAAGFTEDERNYWGVFAQGQQQLTEQLVVNAGIRFDKDEYFGNQTTGNLALAWQFSPLYQAGISAAQGYRAPNLQELYGPASWGANPDLQPEESINYEAWVAFDNQQGARSRISLFHNTIDDLINSICVRDCSGWGVYQNANVDEARIRGIELSSSYQMNQWIAAVSLTLQDPKNRETGKRLARRAEQHGRLDLDYLGHNWRLGGSLIAQSERSNSDFDATTLPGYATLNLRGSWQFASAWQLSAKLDNLLDKAYELASGYNTQGRYGEVRIGFNF